MVMILMILMMSIVAGDDDFNGYLIDAKIKQGFGFGQIEHLHSKIKIRTQFSEEERIGFVCSCEAIIINMSAAATIQLQW